MGISKVDYGDRTLIDLTEDTITKYDLYSGITAHGADGEPITGGYKLVTAQIHAGSTNCSSSVLALQCPFKPSSAQVILNNTQYAVKQILSAMYVDLNGQLGVISLAYGSRTSSTTDWEMSRGSFIASNKEDYMSYENGWVYLKMPLDSCHWTSKGNYRVVLHK